MEFQFITWKYLINVIWGSIPLGIAIYIYYKSKSTKRLAYDIKSVALVRDFSEQFPGVKIKCNGKEVKNLTSSKVALWNRGNVEIRKGDIVESEPLAIIAKNDLEILSAKIKYSSNKNSNMSITVVEGGDQARIEFLFFNCDDNSVIDILHTGTGKNDLYMKGALIGARKQPIVRTDLENKADRISFSIMSIFVFLFVFELIKVLNILKGPCETFSIGSFSFGKYSITIGFMIVSFCFAFLFNTILSGIFNDFIKKKLMNQLKDEFYETK